MTLWIRLTLVMVALVAGTTVGILLFTNHVLENIVGARALGQVETQALLLAAKLEDKIGDVKADVLVLTSTSELRELAWARSNSATKRIDGARKETWQTRIAALIKAKLSANPGYLRFEIIGVDDGGRELMRVDWSGPDHSIRIVPNGELQRKGDAEYFQEAMKLRPGEVYVSRVRFNREDDRIALPDVPVLQIATPILAPDGARHGVIAITADARSILNAVRSPALVSKMTDGSQVFVVNDRGEYLIHPDRTRDFGFASGTTTRVIDHMLDLAGALGADQLQVRMLSDNEGDNFGVAIAPVRPAIGAWLGVVVMVPYATIMAPIAAVQKASIIAGLIAIFDAIVLAALMARSIAKPLVQTTRAIKTFTPGVPFAMPEKALKASGEIGVLARTFEKMAAEVTRKTAGLKRESEAREQMKDEFVAMVSHELRTPLTSIAASLGLLVADPADRLSDAAKRLQRIAHSNSLRLVRLINDILDIEKIESGKVELHMRNIDVRPVVEQAIEGSRGFAGQFDVHVRLDPDATHAIVNADIDRLTQVITNLLSNAVKYSPRDGEVLVTIEDAGALVRIGVRDHGPGIPEKFRSHIFERFAQADSSDVRQKGGTGLGLSIVKLIVVKLGGAAGFDAAPGGGTIFFVDLPRCEGQSRADLDIADGAEVSMLDDDRPAAALRERRNQAEFERSKEVA